VKNALQQNGVTFQLCLTSQPYSYMLEYQPDNISVEPYIVRQTFLFSESRLPAATSCLSIFFQSVLAF